METAGQSLFIGGFTGAAGLGKGFVFRPHVALKVQSRDEPDGSDAGSGWMLSAGGDVPLRLVGTEFFPKTRVSFGSMRSATGDGVTLVGLEFKGTFRVGF